MKKILLGLFAAVVAMVVYTEVTAPKRESTLAPVTARVEKPKRTEVAMVRESEAVASATQQTEKIIETNETGPYHIRMEGVQVELVPSRKQ